MGKERKDEEGGAEGPHDLLGVLLGPVLGVLVELGTISLVDLGDLRLKGVLEVGIREEVADDREDVDDAKLRAPLLGDDVHADLSVGGHVGVVDFGEDLDLGRDEGVLAGDLKLHGEDSTLVRSCLGAVDLGTPLEDVVIDELGPGPGLSALVELLEFGGKSASHCSGEGKTT